MLLGPYQSRFSPVHVLQRSRPRSPDANLVASESVYRPTGPAMRCRARKQSSCLKSRRDVEIGGCIACLSSLRCSTQRSCFHEANTLVVLPFTMPPRENTRAWKGRLLLVGWRTLWSPTNSGHLLTSQDGVVIVLREARGMSILAGK
jgi:hypothetical protein